MWSYVQYRTIGRDIERAWANRKSQPPTTALIKSAGALTCQKNPQSSAAKTENDVLKAAYDDNVPERQNDDERQFGTTGDRENQIVVKLTQETDVFDPRNWSLLSRSKNVAILALLIFAQAWAGAADSMANSAASAEFHTSRVIQNLSTTMYLFGVGSGCLVVGPLSETIGRNPTYLISTLCFLFFVLGSALAKSFGGFITCRYLTGLSSSATLGINGASVKDQFRPVKRAFVFPLIAWANVTRESLEPKPVLSH